MELLSGIPLFLQQVNALLRKNFILAWRSKRTTLLRLFSPLLFIGFMFALSKTDRDGGHSINFSEAVRDPEAFVIPSIPACEEKLIIKLPCYDFVWSGSGNQRVESIVNGIMANNPGRRIDQSKVKSFKTKDELNNWLMQNPMRSPGALYFNGDNDDEIRYGVAINSSSSNVKIGRQSEDPVFNYQLPLQHAALREMSRSFIGDRDFSFDISLREFARPRSKIESSSSSLNDPEDILLAFQVLFFLAIAMFGFISQIHSVVLEKELKLRQTMTIMGLYDVAYWTSWYVWEGFMVFLTSLIIVAFGAMFQIDIFLKNNAVIVFLLFFLFMLSMVAVAFAISALIKNSSSTTSVGFFVLIVGTVTAVFSILFYFQDMKTKYRVLWSLFPVNPFSGGLYLLQYAAADRGIGWNEAFKCKEFPCMSYFFSWLLAMFILWTLLAIYLDNILPNSAGVRKPFFYFLKPSYWTGKDEYIQVGSDSIQNPDRSSLDDEDVQEEEETVKRAAKEGIIDPEVAVQLRGFAKSYPKTTKVSFHRFCFCLCCCTCKTTKPFNAVKNFWINFPRNQLFCLLGPNGAGKSTIISCLTGIIPVTSGDAIIYGNSVRSSSGMSRIRKMIGVTAQFDSLWDDISGREHLRLFASVKGLPRAIHQGEVEHLLADVDIVKAANVRAGSYSGGMRRRLSLAIALIGDPKLLILDEPTTGMDPITQRRVWDVIQNAKQGRSIILTTHSMVEADVLSDRIGIMAKGRLRCIGNSTVLKTRFGAGYTAKVSFPREASSASAEESDINAEHREAVKLHFKNRLNVEPKGENRYSLTFTLPNAGEEILAGFFAELEGRVNQFGIKNIQLGLGTLEEVFLNVVKTTELETADPKEKFQTLTLPSGVTIPVAIGEKWVPIPGSETLEHPQGLMVEVFWEQDASGNLCISSFSAEKPAAHRA